MSSPRKLLAYEEVADCSVRLFVGQVMGGEFNPHQPPPEYATVMYNLYTSIMSPRNRLYFKVCKFNCNKRSLYGNYLSDITNFVALS